MPKLPPPPPRIAQNRSGSLVALQVRSTPSTVTMSADTRLSHVSPYLRSSTPMPPPIVMPAIPTVGHVPEGMQTPFAIRPE